MNIEDLIGLTKKAGGKVVSTSDDHKFEFNAEQMMSFKKMIRQRKPTFVTLPTVIQEMLDSKNKATVSK